VAIPVCKTKEPGLVDIGSGTSSHAIYAERGFRYFFLKALVGYISSCAHAASSGCAR